MKPRLKVAKHWQLRVILIDSKGDIAWDDVKTPEMAAQVIFKLYNQLHEDSKHKA